MEEILRHPEIINPYRLDIDSSKDMAFVDDLGIETFLDPVPFYSQDTRQLAMEILVDLGSNKDTVGYRQEVFNDLISDVNLRTNVQKCIMDLSEIQDKVSIYKGGPSPTRKPTMTKGFNLLRKYRDSINNLHDISSANSIALKDVNLYFRSIRESDEFSNLCELVERFENLDGVDFRVFLDGDGSPNKMSAMELAEKKPDSKKVPTLLQRLLGMGKRGEGQSLKDYSGLNKLGEIIQEYIDKQFIPAINKYTDQIKEATRLLEPLDFYAGFADYFLNLKRRGFDICTPTLPPMEERRMTVRNARNPLLVEVKSNGRKIVPNDIVNNADENMFIITGPNNGGKTTYVKTIGLIQLLSQKGLFVPAKSADVSFVDGMYTHFISPDDITKGEGRYRNELRRIKEIFEKATPYSLVILDEPCGGTSYEEGQRQSLALLDGFHRLGPTTYFTTHMHLLTKEIDSGRYPAARNLSVECMYDGKEITYTYKVQTGAFGKSFGEEIARELGLMPDDIKETVLRRAEKEGYGDKLRE